MCSAPVACLDEQVHVGFQKMPVHGDRRSIRQNEVGVIPELLNEAENVVPATAIQARRVVAQFVENFIHFEGGENRLNQDSCANCATRNAEFILSKAKDVVP